MRNKSLKFIYFYEIEKGSKLKNFGKIFNDNHLIYNI